MKNFLTFSLFLISISVASAQFGVRIGANLANVSSDPEVFSTSSRFGISGGLFYQVKASDNLIIQPEINFVQQGFKTELSILGITATSNTSLNYLQIPVLLKYGFGNMEAMNFFVQAGPYLGLGMGKIKSKSCASGVCETSESDFGSGDGQLKSSDFGLDLGAGININSNLSVDVRYALGLSDLDNSSDGTAKNTAINIGVGYKF